MAPPATTLANGLHVWLSEWLTKQRLPTQFRVAPLAGDGSPRPFYRIQVGDRGFVLLSEPAWTLSKDYPSHQAYLKAQGVPVPEFLAVNEKLGALLMEDLGDELLQARILREPKKKLAWLEKTVDVLAHLHGATFPVPRELPVSTRRFDAAKYSQELQFTFEHLSRGLFHEGPVDPTLWKNVEAFCERIAAFTPDVFSHRDYHTRNLLVHEGKLRLIDFQDARLGPVEYDLASLFYDAYVPVTQKDRAALLARYREKLAPFALSKKIPWDGFEERLESVAYQRVVKAAGSFASFFTRYGKRTHLPYLVPALRSAMALAERLGDKVPPLPLESWLKKAEKEKA